ncbi:putative F-actin-capping protein subunit beta [Camellia lanceoleosa]|uniref:F-actin-capping protein subunit beta n=1 Tax=Camellia lanceoleosa TaxID=1840588 RepID=A0ACC0GY93_9ERIC|nr:putative F-actin-capping protein subunit beta [Camellia lanceoleosa]
MEAEMGLMRRIPPKHTETALSAILSLLPDHSFHLLSQVDQPLQVLCDMDCGKEFILCEYNRDADSYRYKCSPPEYLYTDTRKSAIHHFKQALSIDLLLWAAYDSKSAAYDRKNVLKKLCTSWQWTILSWQ